jgi:hypothetical protein
VVRVVVVVVQHDEAGLGRTCVLRTVTVVGSSCCGISACSRGPSSCSYVYILATRGMN